MPVVFCNYAIIKYNCIQMIFWIGINPKKERNEFQIGKGGFSAVQNT